MDSWLTKTFLEDLIHKNSKDGTKVTVTDFHVKPAVSAGSNFLASLYRITVEYGKEKLYLIAKTLPTAPTVLEFMSEIKALEKEDHFYRKTVHRLQGARDLVPKCFLSSAQGIFLEDLAQQGFKMADRLVGLDFQHMRLVVRSLARFHASSVALYLQDPESMNVFGETQFLEEDRHGLMSKYFHGQIEALANGMEKWPGYEKYAAKLKSIYPTAMMRMSRAVKPQPGTFQVLNHSDLWVSNMLFHYDSVTGNVDKVKFIDFQILRFGSPVLDLQLCLYTSSNDDTRVKKFPELLEEYHDELRAILVKLGLDPNLYTLEQLKLDWEAKKDYGFLMVCMDLSGMLTEAGADVSDDNEISFESTIASKRFQQVFTSLIPYFESQGLL